MSELTTPHDHYWRASLQDLELAMLFFRFILNYLPKNLASRLAPGLLEPASETSIDNTLRKHIKDMLFRIRLPDDEEARPYLLLEHKAHPESGAGLQILRYVLQIVLHEMQKQDKTEPVPAVLPIIFNQGPPAWKLDKEVTNLFVPADLEAYLSGRFILIDLTQISDDQFPLDPRIRTFLMLLKYARRKDRRENLHRVLAHYHELPDGDQRRAHTYIDEAWPDVTPADLDAITTVKQGKVEPIMGHLTDAYIERGFERARTEFRPVLETAQRAAAEAEIRAQAAQAEAQRLAGERRATEAQLAEAQAEAQRLAEERRATEAQLAEAQAEAQRQREEVAAAAAAMRLALIAVLQGRFDVIPDNHRTDIEAADLTQLQEWLSRSPTASTLQAVFDPTSSSS